MAEVRVHPAAHVDGEVRVGGDKSISHRALVIASVARGRSYLGNLSPAADVEATARCLSECQVWVRPFGGGRVSVEGSGPGRSLSRPAHPLYCANSGTTMRLLTGILAAHGFEAALDGDESLRRRPMRRIAEPLSAMGAVVITAEGGTPPLTVRGSEHLRGIEWAMPVASAQVKSAILLAGLSADTPTTVVEPVPSRDHTERLLRLCGIGVDARDGRVTLEPGTPQPFGLRIPGDISSAAFFLALGAARPGWRVLCRDVGVNPARTGILDVLRSMGAQVDAAPGDAQGVEPQADIEVHGAALHATSLEGELTVRSIDEIPVIAVLATQAEGTTVIRDAAELRTKESDRIEVLAAGLHDLGASCEVFADGLAVLGPSRLRPARLVSAGDHRLAMAWAVAAALVSGTGETAITEAESVAVSNPSFFDDMARLAS